MHASSLDAPSLDSPRDARTAYVDDLSDDCIQNTVHAAPYVEDDNKRSQHCADDHQSQGDSALACFAQLQFKTVRLWSTSCGLNVILVEFILDEKHIPGHRTVTPRSESMLSEEQATMSRAVLC